MTPRYLTKSRFKLALECPTKLFYYDRKKEYANQSLEDSFLKELANGGFQIGELARCYFPSGHKIETLDNEDALSQTQELLKQDNVVIFEAAVRYNNLFIRADILIKRLNVIELIEVKAKSIDSDDDDKFYNKDGTLSSKWFPYLADVAFQKYVIYSAFPGYDVSAFMMLADKKAVCPTDGLNQKFKIITEKDDTKSVIVSADLSKEDLSVKILKQINVDECCDIIYDKQYFNGDTAANFTEHVSFLTDHRVKDSKIISRPSRECGSCEFITTEEQKKAGYKSGFNECWKESLNWTDADLLEPTVLDIWKFHYKKKDKCFNENRIKLCDVVESDISPKRDNKPGYSASERQWCQVQKAQNKDNDYWIDSQNLKREMDRWVYPLHFIDFETSMAAIPFNKGRHPYEGIAFQFSHHIVCEDGRVEHVGQYLNATPGFFPNYEFVRNLKKELEHDQGSIFRYAAHENTFLNFIYGQLKEDQNNIPDREELCHFIRSITKASGKNGETGERNMIDMLELVQRYYYDPFTKGSNSLKKVLPAILQCSQFLQRKYSEPIYGADGGIKSSNYRDWQWIKKQNGKVMDPYTLLPRMFQDITDEELDLLSDDDELKDGGAALAAYARMQFKEMTKYERNQIEDALKKYCELDTLAMVMLYEGWKDLIERKQ